MHKWGSIQGPGAEVRQDRTPWQREPCLSPSSLLLTTRSLSPSTVPSAPILHSRCTCHPVSNSPKGPQSPTVNNVDRRTQRFYLGPWVLVKGRAQASHPSLSSSSLEGQPRSVRGQTLRRISKWAKPGWLPPSLHQFWLCAHLLAFVRPSMARENSPTIPCAPPAPSCRCTLHLKGRRVARGCA